MKKLFFAVLLCFSVNGFAQLIQFGPQFSGNITSAISNDFVSKSSGNDIGYGGFVRLNLALFYAQAEIGYTKSKFSVSETGVSETQYELGGSDATLLAGIKIIPLGKLGNVRAFAGYNWKNYSDINTTNDFNTISLAHNNHSILAGVGVDIWRLTLDYRYIAGITDLDPSERDLKTGVSNVSLGFKFL
jgi:hypothetical protein